MNNWSWSCNTYTYSSWAGVFHLISWCQIIRIVFMMPSCLNLSGEDNDPWSMILDLCFAWTMEVMHAFRLLPGVLLTACSWCEWLKKMALQTKLVERGTDLHASNQRSKVWSNIMLTPDCATGIRHPRQVCKESLTEIRATCGPWVVCSMRCWVTQWIRHSTKHVPRTGRHPL